MMNIYSFSLPVTLANTSGFVPSFLAIRHDKSEAVACANLASAKAIAEGRAPSKVDKKPEVRLNVQAFVSPTGQYYVMHGNQRMDVANKQSALYYAKNGVLVETMMEAWKEDFDAIRNRFNQ